VTKTAIPVQLALLVCITATARLQPNIGYTLRFVLMVFTRSGINPPNVSRFCWNREH